MNGASKILTVSYGTFSCTLEGFEDPFNTMKAIAEYFRDLAAEDRYFGAEPPQPDAAMLHRIAEREIQRRVEAKIQDNGVILRAEDNDRPRTGEASALRPAEPVHALAEPGPQPSVEMPARTAAAQPKPAPVLAQAETDAPTSAEAGTESVAEKLSRLRKATAQNQGSVETASVVTAVAPVMALHEDDFAEAPYAGVVEDAELPSALVTFEDNLTEDLDATAAEIVTGDLPPEIQTLDDDTADDEDIAELMALDAARFEDLEQMIPVASEQDATLNGDGMVAEVESPAQSDASATSDDAPVLDETDDTLLSNLVAGLGVPSDEDKSDAGSMVEGESEAMQSDDALLASLGALIDPEEEIAADEPRDAMPAAKHDLWNDPEIAFADDDAVFGGDTADSPETQAAATETTSDDLQAAPEPEAAPQTDLLDPSFDAGAEPTPSQSDAAQEQDTAPVAAESAPASPVRPVRPVRTLRPATADRPVASDAPAAGTEAQIDTADETDGIAETESRTPITVEKLQRARARVIKIRRNDATAIPEQPVPVAAPAPLSHEAEAALAAELAALEQETPTAEAARPAAAAQAPKSDPSRERRLGLPTEDVAVTRLMAEASTQMEVPDTKRRQSAIAHLKAAVAATIAERRATGSTLAGNGSERAGAYRDDLAKVVRPSANPASATGERPAPLVLVSEQRIDRPAEPAPTAGVVSSHLQPVRPRRPVTSAAPSLAAEPDADDDFDLEDTAGNIFEADNGFPDFAERLGATDLPDLLEAAAAYIACVEGRDSFTRPQLMRHIGTAAEGLSREDGLRSFGTLLRDGVIERSRRGQFAISEASPLLAEARKIAG